MTEFKRTYSLVEIAERLWRARTTLADWARQFKEFLPTVGSGRSMRYTEESLEIFGLISKMKDANEPPEYIREQLRGIAAMTFWIHFFKTIRPHLEVSLFFKYS